MSKLADDLIDLVGRIMFAHSIAPEHLQSVLGGDLADARAIVSGGRPSQPLIDMTIVRLELFVAILVRMEWRLRGDSSAIRDALDLPLETLGHVSPASMLGGDLEDLRAVRRAIDTIAAPAIRWWRVGH